MAISLPQTTYAIATLPDIEFEATCRYSPCVYGTPDETCTAAGLTCSDCTSGISRTLNGITTTTKGEYAGINCPTYETDTSYSCGCVNQRTTYKCASGYYGTATSSSAGCTACPSNATCAGGNNSTFVCATGYYKSGSSCAPCPQHSSSGIYGSSDSGSTSNTSCYISAGTSWNFSDTKGSGSETFPSTCYYSN